MGHFKTRAIIRLVVNVRECFPIVLKCLKFHNATTYCNKAPLNWIHCPLNTA